MTTRTKHRTRSTIVVGVAAAGAISASLLTSSPAAASSSGPTITTWISGLNTPRGVAFDGQGSLYVSESGVAGSGPAGLTRSGRVTKYSPGTRSALWSTRFQSLYASEDPTQPPDVLGPEGISALGRTCASASTDQHNRCHIRLIMSESHDGVAAATGGAVNAAQAGHLYALNGATGAARSVSDFGDQQYAWTGNHKSLFPDDFPDSNPYGVLVIRDAITKRIRTFVADAGANTISEVMANGRARIVSYIPNETRAPFRDATPTCITQGPDGMLYVATLNFVANLFVYHSGQSNVWRVDPNANYPKKPTLWARGLTTATSCTFDRAGNFWATEMFQPNTTGAPGDVVRIPFHHPGRLQRMGGGRLPLPGGIAQGLDGAMYVSVNSASPVPGSGAIVKIQMR